MRLEIPEGRAYTHGGSTGELREQNAERVIRYYIDGGFAQVRADVVTVLTQKAIPAAELNEQEAGRQLTAAHAAAAKTPEERDAQEKAEAGRAQLHLARKVRGN